jgi:sugar phosphate isomerase/epimerase
MLNFSCADFTFPVLQRTAALKLVKLLGFDHVDIGLFARSSHFSPGELQSSSRQYTTQVLSDLNQAELKASDIFLQIGVDPSECAANDPSSAVRGKSRDTFAHALDFCVALGCRHLTGLPGVFHSGVSQDRGFHLAEEEASWRVRASASAGVVYAIEPHVGSICSDVTSTRAFLRQIEGLTLTLDYGHFVMAGESSRIIHTLLPFASHLHVRGGALDRLQTSLEENTIDFTGMMDGLKRLDYGGFLTLEYVWVDWKGCNRTDNVSETILLRRALETVAN